MTFLLERIIHLTLLVTLSLLKAPLLADWSAIMFSHKFQEESCASKNKIIHHFSFYSPSFCMPRCVSLFHCIGLPSFDALH